MTNLKLIKNKGFTLLELLIVIAIIAILSVALVIVLNPSEAIKKSRDSQRISDVNTLKKAIGIYVTNTASPKLGGTDNVGCKGTTSDSVNWQPTDKVWYSYPSDAPGAPITGTSTQGTATQVTKANLNLTNGLGWIPINFSSLADGSPISNIPVDPINKIITPGTPTNTDLVYRYTCSEKDLTYEINATLESDAYTITDNRMAKDGGNSDLYYESGTNLNVMAGESFTPPDPCAGKSLGDTCTNGVLYGGTGYSSLGSSWKYMTTPGNCTNYVNNSTGFTPTCNGATDSQRHQWASGTTANIVTGANSATAGLSNTTILATNYTDTNAARYCKNMTYPATNGYTDWYLPSVSELNQVLYSMKVAGKGSFSTYEYSSSTESSATNMWYQEFSFGTQYSYGKNPSLLVRCVRRY